MRKSRAFLAFLLAFLSINGISHASDTIPLSCANKTNYAIRISNVIKGCEKTEVSLGAGAIPRSMVRPYELDKQLVYQIYATRINLVLVFSAIHPESILILEGKVIDIVQCTCTGVTEMTNSGAGDG